MSKTSCLSGSPHDIVFIDCGARHKLMAVRQAVAARCSIIGDIAGVCKRSATSTGRRRGCWSDRAGATRTATLWRWTGSRARAATWAGASRSPPPRRPTAGSTPASSSASPFFQRYRYVMQVQLLLGSRCMVEDASAPCRQMQTACIQPGALCAHLAFHSI